MEGAIIDRLRLVRRPGQYLGLLEWVAWGVAQKKRVRMLFGSQVWDLMAVFAPAHPEVEHTGECRVAAVNLQLGGKMLTVGLRTSAKVQVNHYVIGLAASDEHSEVEGEGIVFADPSACAQRAALQAGWLLKGTVAQGDCGVDVMAYHLGLERTRASWDLIRESIT